MDQDGTGHGDGPRSRPRARWEPSFHPQKRGRARSQFSAHFYCSQTAGYIKMPLGIEVGLGQGHIVLDSDPAPPKRTQAASFRPMSTVAKRLYV